MARGVAGGVPHPGGERRRRNDTPLTDRQAYLRALQTLVCAAFFLWSAASRSVELDREVAFEIRPQPLASALIQFSKQANLQVVTSGSRVAGAESRGVVGRYTLAQALERLLEGTGFTYQPIGDGTISVIVATTPVKPKRTALEDSRAADTGPSHPPGAGGAGSPLSSHEAGVPATEIVVTGTRAADRTVAESLSPIDVLSAEAISGSGSPEMNQQLSRLLPSFNFPRPSITDGTDHVRPAQLRGLSPDQTLVLVNGKRRHTTAIVNLNGAIGRGSSPADLNALPMSAVDRVEVLRDGASAQYGSDAIAGVINMILREASSGGSADVRIGEHAAGDGRLLQASGWLGLPLATNGFLTLTAEYRDRDPTDRSGPDPRQMFPTLPDGSPDPREAAFDRHVFQYGDAQAEDRIVFVNAGMPFGGDRTLYLFANYSNREGKSPGIFRRPLDSRNVPEVWPNGFLPFIASDVDDAGVVAGIRGAAGDWKWDASVNYGGNRFRFGVENSVNTRLGAASPTSFYSGTLENGQTLANLDLARGVDIAGMAGPLNVALGVEYRDESYRIHPGEPASYFGTGAQVFPGFTPQDAIDASRRSYAGYLDAEGDVTERLSASAALRFEDYSDFGSATSGKLAGRYKLTDRLAFRATASTGFRAPSLAQQSYSTTATIFPIGGASPADVHTFRVSDPVAIALGAEPLDKEKSRNLSIGAVAQPLRGLFVTLDAYRIDIDDRIVLSEDFTGDAVRAFLASRGFANSDGGRYFTNAIDTKTYGADLLARYAGALPSGGRLTLTLGYNWNRTRIERVAPDPPVLVENGFDFVRIGRPESGRVTDGSPRDKLILGAHYARGPLELLLNGVRYGEWSATSIDPALDQGFGAEIVLDLALSYELQKRLFVTLGADNVTDAYPDKLTPPNNFHGILPYSAMSPFGFNGAFYYLKLRHDFGR